MLKNWCNLNLRFVNKVFKRKKSAADDLYNIVIAPKSTQKYQEIYRLIVQLALMAAASSKTEMTPCGHVFPDRETDNHGALSAHVHILRTVSEITNHGAAILKIPSVPKKRFLR